MSRSTGFRFRLPVSLLLLILSWAMWGAIMSAVGMFIGPGVVSLFVSGIFALVGLTSQTIVLLRDTDGNGLVTSVVACLMSSALCAFVFQPHDLIWVTALLFAIFVVPMCTFTFVVRRALLANTGET